MNTIRGLIAACVVVAAAFAQEADEEVHDFHDNFHASVDAVRLLDGDGKIERIDVLIDATESEHRVNTDRVREAVGVVGRTRMPELQEQIEALMTRAGFVRVRLDQLDRAIGADAPDAEAILDDLVDLETASHELVGEAQALVEQANALSPAEIAAAERAAQRAEQQKQQAAAEAAARAAQQQAAQERAAQQATLATTNPEYRDVSSENFWKEQYGADSELVAEIETNQGTMVVEFWPDVAPGHVKNFIDLAKKDFYDGLLFHRVIPDFMIQGGCPEGTGMGGPGYKIAAEFNKRPHERGVLSMARSGDPNSAGSQFFVCHAKAPHLDGQYTAFGRLLSGYDALDAIATTEAQGDRPVEDQKMLEVTVRPRTDADTAEAR